MTVTIVWIVLLVVLLGVELATMGLTTIWFAGGALVAAIASALGAPVWLSAGLFVVVSAVLLFFTRPVAMKHFNNRLTRTNVDSVIGTHAIVIEEINNLKGEGRVKVDGKEWSARSADESAVIPKDAVVEVKEVSGVKLIVG
ncbi:MAG: NfeD family protein [Lachnospiraceae bacterium]|nr:NfeD family protein [Lachnospiraceae bacterium]